MVFSALVMLILITAAEGVLVWFGWRRLAAHLKENPAAVAALTEHLFIPLLGREKK